MSQTVTGRSERNEPGQTGQGGHGVPLPHHHADVHDLAGFGYVQKLDRTLGSFSSFAAGFSYISILTGMFQLFYFGFASGGPAFFWTWPMVFAGQFLVALCFAELGAHYPLAGSVYQWSKQVSSRFTSWMAGWMMLTASVVTVAAVAIAWQVILPQIWSGFQVVGSQSAPTATDVAENAVLLGTVLVVLTTVVNAVGVKLMSRINNVGVISELVGVVLLIVLLAFHLHRGPQVVFTTHGTGAGYPTGYFGAFLVASLMSIYVMYGFDTAGSLAEETTSPRKHVPRALLRALGAAGIAGALLLLLGLMSVRNINAPEIGTVGLPYIVKDVLGDGLGKVLLVFSAVAIGVCCLAVHTATIRIMFSMARDNGLPGSRRLAHVSTRQTPVVPSLIVGVLAIVLLVVNVGQPQVFTLMTSVAVMMVYVAYLLVTSPLLRRRLAGWPRVGGTAAGQAAFTLGRAGVLVNAGAVLWGAAMIVNLGWPRNAIYNTGATKHAYWQWFAIEFVGAIALIGAAYFLLVQRHKLTVLDEHRATVPAQGGPAGELPTQPAPAEPLPPVMREHGGLHAP